MGKRNRRDVAGVEKKHSREDIAISAAILGFYGASKCAIKAGYDPRKVFQLVLKEVVTDKPQT